MGAAMLLAAMLAAIAFLCTGFGSMTTGLEKDFEGLESAAFDATAPLAATLLLVFDNAATAGPAALVPGVFAIAFAALSVIFAFRKRISLSGRPEVVPLVEDDQDSDDNEADCFVWNDLLRLFVHHAVAPLPVPALDDSSEFSLALSCHFPSDVFTVMQHGLPGELVDVEVVLSAAASDLEDDQVMMQAAAALEAEVAGSVSLEDEVVTLSEEYFAQFFCW